MIVKIFLREFTYIYRGDIEYRKIREYIKTITKRSFIIKWKDQDDELITISQKQDIIHFYELQKSNPKTNNMPFKLYIQEIFSDTQNYQSSSQTQIVSKLQSPQQKSSNLKQQQNFSQFNFGQYNDYNMLKSQEISRDQQFIKQEIKLETIEEKQDSYGNFSAQNLDKLGFSFSERPNIKTKSLQYQQVQEELPIQSHESFDNYDPIQSEKSLRITAQFARKEIDNSSPIKIKVENKFFDMKMLNEESQIIEEEIVGEKLITENKQNKEEREELKGKKIFCDSCSFEIDVEDDKIVLYTCEFCEDCHFCLICYNEFQEQVHFHQVHQI